ncbi:MAG TPA: helix-turn-helix transcriptional regulator [Bacillota bacterium]|nr:helix-turn-helix transcriptional regulator [Bacillota bacterium]
MDEKKILKIMKEKGMNSKRLSELSGIPVSTVNKIIYGITRKPSVNAMRAIVHALDCTLDELLDEENEKETEHDELTEYLDELHKRPEMKMLFKVAKGATKEDVEKAAKIIEMFKGGNSGDGDDI